jgi:outer membrane protein assembly factor BamB
LNKNTGDFVWEKCNPGSQNVGAPVTVTNSGILFAGAWDGILYALSTADGSVLWSASVGQALKSSGPLVTSGMVITGHGYRTSGSHQIKGYSLVGA